MPFFAATAARARLERMQRAVATSLANGAARWPQPRSVMLLRLFTLMFPASDFRRARGFRGHAHLLCEHVYRSSVLTPAAQAPGADPDGGATWPVPCPLRGQERPRRSGGRFGGCACRTPCARLAALCSRSRCVLVSFGALCCRGRRCFNRWSAGASSSSDRRGLAAPAADCQERETWRSGARLCACARLGALCRRPLF